MIKKSTLIVLLCAVALGGAAYYVNQKHTAKEKTPPSADKPAFHVLASDIESLTLSRPAQPDTPPIQLDREKGDWEIVKPVETGADQEAVGGITSGLAAALISGTELGTPDRLKAFGLDPAAVSIEFAVKGGGKHTLLLGDKDFTGDSVYALADGGKTVDLLPQTLLVSSDKRLEDLRDRSVLRVQSGDIAQFTLKNPSGEIALAKDSSGWNVTKPAKTAADADTVNELLAGLTTAKMDSVVSEKPEDLGKYGLASPGLAVTTLDNKGNRQTLIVGKKDGDTYFARDLSRPMIFRINEDLFKKLSENFQDLRDKTVLHIAEDQIDRIELQNPGGTTVIYRKEPGKEDWAFAAPASEKGKAAASWKILSPIQDARADEVLDHASAAVAASLAKPAIEVTLIDKDGKKTTLDVSKPDGAFVYARTSASPVTFKLKKSFYDDLNFTPGQAQF